MYKITIIHCLVAMERHIENEIVAICKLNTHEYNNILLYSNLTTHSIVYIKKIEILDNTLYVKEINKDIIDIFIAVIDNIQEDIIYKLPFIINDNDRKAIDNYKKTKLSSTQYFNMHNRFYSIDGEYMVDLLNNVVYETEYRDEIVDNIIKYKIEDIPSFIKLDIINYNDIIITFYDQK